MSESTVEYTTQEAQHILTKDFTSAAAELSAKLGDILPSVYAYVMQQNYTPGRPFTLYYKHDEENGVFEVAAGLEVAQEAQGSGEIVANTLPGGESAVYWHIGPYDTLGESHDVLLAQVANDGKEPCGPVREIYVTDPGQEPDASKWKTKLVLPIKNK